MSGNMMKEKLSYDIRATIGYFMNKFFELSKKDTEESKESIIDEATDLVHTVISQNAIKAEETKKEIKSEVLEDIRKEMVTKDYIDQKFDYVEQQFKASKDYVSQQFKATKDYIDQKFDYVEQQFKAEREHTDAKIANLKSDMIKWMLGVGVSATIVIVGANYTLITLLIDALKN